MKAGRLVALLLTLQNTRNATAARLAKELDVSVRTVYRDVAALQAAGVPLWTEPGPTGGIRLLEGWRTRLDGLTGDEAAALFLGAIPTAVDGLGLGTVAVAAQAKVLATLPPSLRSRATRLRERFHLDAPGWFREPDEVPHLAAIAEGVWRQRKAAVTYPRGDGYAVRDVDPLGLILKAGVWYAAVRTPRGHLVTYRVAKVRDARLLDEGFERPEGFDLAEWWQRAQAEFDEVMQPEPVRLRLGPRGVEGLAHAIGKVTADRALATAGPPDADGWIVVEVGLESVRVALRQLTVLGADVEVLAPSELRAALAEVGAAMAARNRV